MPQSKTVQKHLIISDTEGEARSQICHLPVRVHVFVRWFVRDQKLHVVLQCDLS